MNRRTMPLILMLLAGVVTCIITFIMQYTIIFKLLALLVVLLVFYTLGSIFKWVLDMFDRQNAKIAMEQGEVIQKENLQEEQEKSLEETSEEA